MKVQRVRHPESERVSWLVLDDGYRPISAITGFLTYLEHIDRSPHTIRSYAHHLKLYWEYLRDAGLDWTAVGLSELADFVGWLRSPQVRVVAMHEQEARRSEATVNVILTAVAMFYEYHARIGTVEEIPLYRSQMQPRRRYKGFLHHISKGKPVRTRLIKLRAPQRIPKTLSTEQVTQLIAACQRRRDRFLISLPHLLCQRMSSNHRQTQPNDPSPITNVPVAENAGEQSSADAYDDLNSLGFPATPMLLFADSSFGSV